MAPTATRAPGDAARAPGPGLPVRGSRPGRRRGHTRCPAGRRDDGRSDHARQQCDEWLLRGRRRATQRAFRGGWLHSGDLAVPDGNIELRDRAKDIIIISGGENISSIEVEQRIVAHSAVLECAVIGIPHERWGERPKAFVTLTSGAGATAEEIIAFCRQRLARYKCPDAVVFGPFPKTSTGKVQKTGVARTRDAHRRDIGR